MLKDLSPLCPLWKRISLSWRAACLQVGWGESFRHLHEFSKILGEVGKVRWFSTYRLFAWPSNLAHPVSLMSFFGLG